MFRKRIRVSELLHEKCLCEQAGNSNCCNCISPFLSPLSPPSLPLPSLPLLSPSPFLSPSLPLSLLFPPSLSSLSPLSPQLLWKFIASEEDYVSQLMILKEEFHQQCLMAANSRSAPLSLDQCHQIFRNRSASHYPINHIWLHLSPSYPPSSVF